MAEEKGGPLSDLLKDNPLERDSKRVSKVLGRPGSMTYQDWVTDHGILFGFALSLRNVPYGVALRRKETWHRIGRKVKALLVDLNDNLGAVSTEDWTPYELSQREALLRQMSEVLEQAQRNWTS